MVQRGPASLRPAKPSREVIVQGREAYEGLHTEVRPAGEAGSCNFCRRNINWIGNGRVPIGKVVELSGGGLRARLCEHCLRDLIDGYHAHLAKENL